LWGWLALALLSPPAGTTQLDVEFALTLSPRERGHRWGVLSYQTLSPAIAASSPCGTRSHAFSSRAPTFSLSWGRGTG
jgi:hypothetical protein